MKKSCSKDKKERRLRIQQAGGGSKMGTKSARTTGRDDQWRGGHTGGVDFQTRATGGSNFSKKGRKG